MGKGHRLGNLDRQPGSDLRSGEMECIHMGEKILVEKVKGSDIDGKVFILHAGH